MNKTDYNLGKNDLNNNQYDEDQNDNQEKADQHKVDEDRTINENQNETNEVPEKSDSIAEDEQADEERDEQNDKIEDERKTYIDEEKQEDHRFQEGDLLTFVNVRFPGNSRSFPFLLGNKIFHYGQKVMALSDRGMTVGYINSFPYSKKFSKEMLPLFTISKVATNEDLQKEKNHIAAEKKAEIVCNDLIQKYQLEMNLTHVEFMQYGKKAVFFFTAPNRVDFRNLVKDLVTQLKMRIELRQISVRDRAASLGSTGPCGLQTCCSSFLKNYGNVTIKMAKNQNLALMPNKINGVCSQIKCCIKYEHELYSEKRKLLPKENAIIQTKNGDKGKVQTLHLLNEEFEMITSEGKIRRYVATQFHEGGKILDDWKMPDQFESIVNETKEVIGKKIEPILLEKTSTLSENNNSTSATHDNRGYQLQHNDENKNAHNNTSSGKNFPQNHKASQREDGQQQKEQRNMKDKEHSHHHRSHSHHFNGHQQRSPKYNEEKDYNNKDEKRDYKRDEQRNPKNFYNKKKSHSHHNRPKNENKSQHEQNHSQKK